MGFHLASPVNCLSSVCLMQWLCKLLVSTMYATKQKNVLLGFHCVGLDGLQMKEAQ